LKKTFPIYLDREGEIAAFHAFNRCQIGLLALFSPAEKQNASLIDKTGEHARYLIEMI